MQIIVIAVLTVIAGLSCALLACAMSLTNRIRAANTTLRRIEEALLSLNQVKAIDSAVKSAEPMTQPQPAVASSVGYLTVRELKMMSSGDRQSAHGAPIPNGQKPLRTSVPTSSDTDLRRALGHGDRPAVHSAEVAAHGAVGIALKTEATGQNSAAFADRDPRFVTPTQEMLEASEGDVGLDSSFEIPSPRPDQQILSVDLRNGAGDAVVHVSQVVVTAVAHEAPTVNGELPIQRASEAVEEASVPISPAIREIPPASPTGDSGTLREPGEALTITSAVGREVSEVGQRGQTAPTSNVLDEERRKKREQEALMIINNRRRRARAGR